MLGCPGTAGPSAQPVSVRALAVVHAQLLSVLLRQKKTFCEVPAQADPVLLVF